MSDLDKRYELTLDLTVELEVDTMIFSESDEETSDFYVTFTRKRDEVLNLRGKTVTLYTVNPHGYVGFVNLTFDTTEEKFHCNLPYELKNVNGNYIGQIVIMDSETLERIVVPTKIRYCVNEDYLSEATGGDIDDGSQIEILKALTQEVLTLSSQYDELKNDISDLHNGFNYLNTSFNELDDSFNDLKSQVEGGLEGNFGELQDALNKLQVNFNTLQNEFNTLKGQIGDDLEGGIDEIKNELRNDINELEGSFTELQGTVTELENGFTQLQNSFTGLSDNVTSLQDTVTTLQGDITELEGIVNGVQSGYDGLQSDIREIEGRLDSINTSEDKFKSTYESSAWILNGDKYELMIIHNLDSTDLGVFVRDMIDNGELFLDYEIINSDIIKLISYEAYKCMVKVISF